jgi:hypothetical protein
MLSASRVALTTTSSAASSGSGAGGAWACADAPDTMAERIMI